MNILFVCTGNTCRSPMAEHLIKHKTSEIKTKSAGIFAAYGQQANDHARAVMDERGMDMDHRSQPVDNDLLDWADLVLTMTIQHKQSLIMQFPHYQEKYYTLKEYLTNDDNKVRSDLQKAYAQYEEKRTQFIRENEHLYDNNRLDEMVVEKFQSYIDKIQQLESSIFTGDISDPFGGDISVYRETLAELDKYTSQLIAKIKNK